MPGETTAEEAVGVLGRSPVIAEVEASTSPLNPRMGYVTWKWIEDGKRGEAIFDTQNPDSTIYIIYPYFPTSFALGDVIAAYGEPSHIIARPSYAPDIGGDASYDLRILYQHLGLILLDKGEHIKPALDENTQFETVAFFALNEEGLQAALGGAAAYPEWLIPWQGMQDFDFYCRDEEGEPCP